MGKIVGITYPENKGKGGTKPDTPPANTNGDKEKSEKDEAK